MKLKRGLAEDIRNTAWKRPRKPPMIKADEADGMFLFLTGDLLILKILLPVFDSSSEINIKKLVNITTKKHVNRGVMMFPRTYIYYTFIVFRNQKFLSFLICIVSTSFNTFFMILDCVLLRSTSIFLCYKGSCDANEWEDRDSWNLIEQSNRNSNCSKLYRTCTSSPKQEPKI